MAAAMGTQNVVAKEAVTNCPPTTVMTSTLINVATHFSSSLNCFAHGEHQKGMEYAEKLYLTIMPLIFFIIGCLVGGGVASIGFYHFSVIVVVVNLVVVLDLVLKEKIIGNNPLTADGEDSRSSDSAHQPSNLKASSSQASNSEIDMDTLSPEDLRRDSDCMVASR